ncbi:sensor histidine kinase [Actinocrispum wychmicini]|uniref:histidine kinase n=1 Tax=Actinocrispum wychmicini TaxID=1213861 RepID=A0A4R2JC35_9PSEU|nr:HAMP domain-containing sensor histidine kinase [Actinocrispum wychmicini]TCO54298.1 signal transduction histidine kinase [Actinocrispum wychmicini]
MTARTRLALLYTGLVLVAAAALTTLTYVLMRQSLGRRFQYLRLGVGSPPPQIPDVAEQVRSATLSQLLVQASIALGLVVVLAAVLGWLVAGRVLRPIRVISATARRLSAENLSERVPVNPPADEMAALATTVNGMLDRIQRGIDERDRVLASQRMFTANAAHELRTPLTTIRTAIDVTLDGSPDTAELVAMARDVRTAVDHSRRTLDGLLSLARSQAGPISRHHVDLAALAGRVLAAVSDITAHAELHPAHVRGEPVLLERMTANLIDNAVRYNHPHGRLWVTTGVSGGPFLRVVNTGPRVVESTVDDLLRPFVRGTSTRGGAGLGLAIVRAVVDAHDGEITMCAPATGGLDVTVRFIRPG